MQPYRRDAASRDTRTARRARLPGHSARRADGIDCGGLPCRPASELPSEIALPSFATPTAACARLRRVLLLAVAVALPLRAQTGRTVAAPGPDAVPDIIETWSIADGLPLNSVNALLQTRDGYIWAATYDGLVRFDGARFTVFNVANSPGLSSDRIIQLTETRDGALWLISESRTLTRLFRGRFTSMDATRGVTGAVYALHEEPSGALWLGTTDGLFAWQGDRFVRVLADRIRSTVLGIVRRRDGSLWLGTDRAGVLRVMDGRVERMSVGLAVDTTEVLALFEDPEARLWMHSNSPRDGGVWRALPGGRPAPHPEGKHGTVLRFAWVPAWRAVVGYSARGVMRYGERRTTALVERVHAYTLSVPMQVRGADSVWHAIGRDIFVNDRRVASLAPSPDAPDAHIVDLLFDRDGDLWIATTGLGLVRLSRNRFTTIGAPEGAAAANAYTVAQDSSGALWMGSLTRGASRLTADGRTVSNFTLPRRVGAQAAPIIADGRDRLLVGTAAMLQTCTLPGLRCESAPLPSTLAVSVLALYRTADDRVLAGAYGEVFERVRGQWRRYPGWTSASRARAFAETRDGALWIGTGGDGLMRCRDGRCRALRMADGLPSDQIRTLHVDADGWLWIGTEGRGLARLDPRTWPADDRALRPAIVHYDVTDGLHDPVVHQILEDGLGRFWFNSNRGIYWVPRADLLAFAEGRIARINSTAYTERDGLRNREGNGGFQPAGIRDRDGRLWFPTQAGLVGVDPRRVPTGRAAPPVVVEQVAARERRVPVDSAPIPLAANERDLEITYAALAFREPANVRFRYRLEPYDADWVEAGTRRTAFYTRVPAGRYVFKVQASRGGEQWSARPAAATIEIAPFPWETLAAKVALALTLLALGWAALRWRLRAAQEREARLTVLVAERTAALQRSEQELAAQNAKLAQLHLLRSRLFANLSHEFRTPLTLILGPLRSLLDGRHGPLAPTVRGQGELMLRNGQRLLRLINQILDLARLQAGAVAISRQPIELVEWTRTLAQAFLPLAERQGIAIVVRSPVRALTVAADAEQLEKVLLNLLSNAVKFTGAGGMVDVAVTAEDDHAVLTVRDTGIGIAAADLPHVFERFYQAESESTRRYDGTGIGLALAKEIVELHGGVIGVTSVPGEGSTFTVRLPLGVVATHPAATGTAGGSSMRELLRNETGEHTASTDLDAADADTDRPVILLVDDNADIRTYLRSILSADFRILEAADGRAGLARARDALPDLIVADVMMPELDGLGLGRALKDDPMTDAIPVILLTARAAAEDQIAGLGTGADLYLVKPFDPGVLTAAVGNLLAQRRRLRERLRTGEAATPGAAPPPDGTPELERRLRPLVMARLLDPAFNPEALAADAGLSYHQLYRGLRDDLDTTPSGFIRRVRAECAADLLRRGAGSVTEVAYAVGFESLSYFRRAFKEQFGCAPTEFLAGTPESPPRG